LGDEHGRVTHLDYCKIELGKPDESGRRRPVPIEGSETLLENDMLITAIGQSPDLSFKNDGGRLNKLKVSRWNTIDADPETLQSSIPYVFVGGDLFTGPALVVEAIGGGRRAAKSIHQYISGNPVTATPKLLYKRNTQESLFDAVEGIKKTPRVKMRELPVAERIQSFIEVDFGISQKDALAESIRCLSCCRLCYNKDPD
jgi:NADPH-dependent glutamate synthase beta subunit-like oxidoreductase